MRLTAWLRARGNAGAVANVVTFVLLAATATSRAQHGVLSPAALVVVVLGAAVGASLVGWVAGLHEGAHAALDGTVEGIEPATADRLAGRRGWRGAIGWSGWAAAWSACGAVVLAAVLHDHSAPFPVIAVGLLALALPAALAVDVAARAAGAAHGAALLDHAPEPTPLLRRAWRDLALPLGVAQVVTNAAAAWLLFHGEAADGTLQEGDALGDTLVFAAILAALFGALGQRWGALDARTGRVAVDPDVATPAGRHPIGPQALVYAGALALVVSSLAGFVVPSSPSLLRVAIVRGALAGGLAALAGALGFVRGAANVGPVDLPAGRPILPPAPVRRARRPLLAGAAAAVLVSLAATVPHPPAASAQALDGLGLVGELDAYAVRVEVDIPLPAGSGSAPHVTGSVRRSSGSEAANGIAAAPSHLDPVVGGRVADPDSTPGTGDENRLPQAECAYPGDLVDVEYTFPADFNGDTADAPALGHSTAVCGAGPRTELHAVLARPDAAAGLLDIVDAGTGFADGLAGPDEGVLRSTASASSSGVSLLGGVVTVDSVRVRGASSTDGQPGGATTEASVDLEGISIAGTTFDLRAGSLVVAGQELPLDGGAADAFLAGLSAALAPTGCAITPLGDPAEYPQGFLFSRPEPTLGVADDGTSAGSMTGGLIVVCDLPVDLTAPTGFSPARIQVVLGFVYTSVAATADIGGFGLGSLPGDGSGSTGEGLDAGGAGGGASLPSSSGTGIGTAAPSLGGGTTAPVASPAAPVAATPSGGGTTVLDLLASNFTEGRPWVWLLAIAGWVVLAHRGLERVRREIVLAEAAR